MYQGPINPSQPVNPPFFYTTEAAPKPEPRTYAEGKAAAYADIHKLITQLALDRSSKGVIRYVLTGLQVLIQDRLDAAKQAIFFERRRATKQ